MSDSLNLGGSIGIGYYQSTYTEAWLQAMEQPDGTIFVDSYQDLEREKMFTAQAGIGFQKSLGQGRAIGVYLQSPAYRFYKVSDATTIEYMLDTTKNSYTQWDERCEKDRRFRQLFPGYLSLGYKQEQSGVYAFTLDIVPVFRVQSDDSTAKRNVVNSRPASRNTCLPP